MTSRLLFAVPLLAALSVAATAQSFDATPVDALVDAHLEFLASDAMAGRDTGTPEGIITARYVAAGFQSAGLEPAGVDGTYLQPYTLEVSQLDVDGVSLAVSGGEGAGESFVLGDDFVVRGQTRAGFDLAAPLLFAGYGIVDESEGRDAYAGVDVEGRVVLLLSGRPEGSEASRSWRSRRREAQERGAAGVIVIIDPDDRQGRGFFDMMTRTLGRTSMSLAGEEEPGFPFLMLTKEAAGRLLALAGLDLGQQWSDRESGALSGAVPLDLTLALKVPVLLDELVAYNTLGMVRGHDPELADEVLVVSAHMDHVGTNEAGEVFNGADDNATGTTTLMTAARVLADNPAPRRSVLFLAVSGEEKGLLGSQWWVEHPTVPLEQVVGNINIDMVGRNDSDSIGTSPSPDHDHYNDLVRLAQALASRVDMTIDWEAGEGDYRRRVDEYYYRSDHVNFANKGIPVVFFFSGEHEDYHRVTDTVDKIDRGKLRRMARFVSILATEVANSDERPRRIEEPSADSR